MKSHMLLFAEVLHEMGTWCCTSTSRDLKTVAARVEHEGVSFLTITLPNFCNDLQKGLSLGSVDPNLFEGFPLSGKTPKFLGGFLDLVFDRETGRLVEDPSIDAIFAIRQITLLFGKINIPCSEERREAALDGFLDCEQSVKTYDSRRTPLMVEEFRRVSRILWGRLLSDVGQQVHLEGVLPKHGPGATAEKLKGNRKYDQSEWTSRLEEVFPAAEYLLPNWSHLPELDRINWLEPGAERPVRVITVPKTLKTPRIIAIEPTCMQYVQQGILEILVERIETDNLMSSFVGFRDQETNRLMAQKASLTGKLATLDLSEASDRVSNQLVKTLLGDGTLARAVDACRSRKADVPGRGVIRLAKFASMGSALCFPIEAMVFLTIIFLGIQDVLKRSLTYKDLSEFVGQVRVYGDDIIVPVEYVPSVVSRLETFGFKVNANKSFWSGNFRESCGGDYYRGEDITVIRVRQILAEPRGNAQEGLSSTERAKRVISTVSLRNQLYKRGMWKTVRFLDQWIERVIPFPAVLETSPVLGKHNFTGFESARLCPNLQRPLVRGMVQFGEAPESNLEGYGALQKFFLKRGTRPFFNSNHLERYGRPDAVDIKIRWSPPF